jgi:phospholipase C
MRPNAFRGLATFVFLLCLLIASYFLMPSVSYAVEHIDARDEHDPRDKIKHVIVLVQGKRSFDHYFGTYPGADGLSNNTKVPVNPFSKDNSSSGAKKYIYPFHFEQVSRFVPKSNSEAYQISYNNGSMNGFVHAQNIEGREGENVMGHYDYRNIPYYWDLASRYVLADMFFSPTMRTGLPNYLHIYAGQDYSGGSNRIPELGLQVENTIFDELEKSQVPWKVYVQDYISSLNYTNEEARNDLRLRYNPLLAIPRFVQNDTLNSRIVDLDQYFTDLKSNNSLPRVSYIIAPEFNERAPKDIGEGQEFAVSLIVALMRSQYWKNSAFILFYDESGGWYDHVKPPAVPSFYDASDLEQGQQGYGFRVPALIISPYAKTGYIDNTPYDAGSVLKFIEYLHDLPPLAQRDQVANNMSNAFDFTKTPDEPYIPLGTYGTNQVSKINTTANTERVQLIYALALAALPSIVVSWQVIIKRRQHSLNA